MPKFTDYREILKDHFEKRKSKNPSYSLRAFARDIGLLPSRLSDILNGRQGLSEARGLLVAAKLSLDSVETEYFLNLIQSRHARNKHARKLALTKLEKSFNMPDVVLNEEQFSQISSWYFFALLELTSLFPYSTQISEMANYLGIEFDVAQTAIQKLIELSLIKLDDQNRFLRSHFRISTTQDVPSTAIQNFHKEIISQAQIALALADPLKRDYSSINIWLSESDLSDLKNEVVRFRRGILKRYQSRKSEEILYALNINLFSLRKVLS